MAVDVRQLVRFERDLDRFARQGVAYAMRNALNDAAFDARRRVNGWAREHWTMRNTWVERGTQVERATVGRLVSRAGSVREFMDEQEVGKVNVPAGKHGVRLPTAAAAGQDGASKRTRVVRVPLRITRVRLSDARKHGKTRQQRNAIAISRATRGKDGRFAYIDTGRRKGIVRVFGRGKAARVRMIHDLTRKSTTTRATHLFEDTQRATVPGILGWYRGHLVTQIARLRVFRGGR